MNYIFAVDYHPNSPMGKLSNWVNELSIGVGDDELSWFVIQDVINDRQQTKILTDRISYDDYCDYLFESVFSKHVPCDMLVTAWDVVGAYIDTLSPIINQHLSLFNCETFIHVGKPNCITNMNLILCNIGSYNDPQ